MDAKTDRGVLNCQKAWIHTGWEDIMQKWKKWLEEMKRRDEKEEMTKPTPWRGGAQILKKEEEDARLLDRCEAKRRTVQSKDGSRV